MDYLKRLDESIQLLEESADQVAAVPQILSSVSELIEEIESEKEEIIKTKKLLDEQKECILRETNEVSILIKNNEISSENTIATIKDSMIHNKKDTIEAIESISTVVNNKLTISESKIEEILTVRLTAMENQLMSFQKLLSSIKTIAILSLLTGITGIILGIML